MPNVWKDLPIGTIIDDDIKKLSEAGELITGNFDPGFVKQACYELRASNIFWDIASPAENKRVDVGFSGTYLLKPNCYTVSIVKEQIRLPANVLARILTKGRLFSIGILPVNTYADPGFEGRLGITLYNASKRYIVIRPGEPIAKIEFSVLPKPVRHAYTGQHGYETEIWPIASHLIADISDPYVSRLIGDDNHEIEASYGPRIATVAKQVQFYSSKVWIQLFLILTGFTILLAIHGHVDLVTSLSLGVVANLITTLGTNLFAVRKYKRK